MSEEASVDAFLDSLTNNLTTADVESHEHHTHEHHHAPASSHHGHHDHSGHVMKMWFHGGFEEVVLFDFWRINTWSGMLFSCILIFIMGAAYEGIKWFRVYLQMSHVASQKCPNKSQQEILPLQNKHSNSNEEVYNPTTTPPTIVRNSIRKTRNDESPFAISRIIQAVLYIIQLVLAYWLMLIVMTYNNYLTAAVILGAGFGHWLFAVLKFRNPLGETADSFATDACH